MTNAQRALVILATAVACAIVAMLLAWTLGSAQDVPPMPPPEVTVPPVTVTPEPVRPVLDRLWLAWVGK